MPDFPTKQLIFIGLLLLAVIALVAQACHKRVLVVPDACLGASKTELRKNDTIVFTNCCRAAEQVQLYFYKVGSMPDASAWASFDASQQFRKVYPDTGRYAAMVRAVNNEVPAQTYTVFIHVSS